MQAAALLFTNHQSHPRGAQLNNSTVAEKLHVVGIKDFGKWDWFPLNTSLFTPIQVTNSIQGSQEKQSITFLHQYKRDRAPIFHNKIFLTDRSTKWPYRWNTVQFSSISFARAGFNSSLDQPSVEHNKKTSLENQWNSHTHKSTLKKIIFNAITFQLVWYHCISEEF